VHDLTLGGAAKTALLVLAAWWAWVYTTWAWLLVAGYVGIQVVRNLFVVLVTHHEDPLYRSVQRIFGWSCAVMPLWIAGALVDGRARVVLWSIALALDYAGPLVGHARPGLGRSHPRDWPRYGVCLPSLRGAAGARRLASSSAACSRTTSMPRSSTAAASRPRRWKRARNGWRARARSVESIDTGSGIDSTVGAAWRRR